MYIGISFIQTHIVAKLAILFLTLFSMSIKSKVKKKPAINILVIFLIFSLGQSLSIINAVDITSYLTRYEDLIFTGLILNLAVIYKINNKKIISILLLSFIINASLQLFIYFYPYIFIRYGDLFILGSYYRLIVFNISRSRVYLDSFHEIFIPILMYQYTVTHEKNKQLIYAISIGLIIFLTLVANTRTGLVMLIVSIAFSINTLIKSNKRVIHILCISIIVCILTLRYQNLIFNTSILERVINTRDKEYGSISSRITDWFDAISIGKTYPLTGAGLNNYYIYRQSNKNIDLDVAIKEEQNLVKSNSHNIMATIFAESGAIGLSTWLLSIAYFLLTDWQIIIGQNKKKHMYIISFWVLFIFSLFNPSQIIKYQVFYWLLRLAIINETSSHVQLVSRHNN